jgi:tetratricopeptide (TPR) repeat protein
MSEQPIMTTAEELRQAALAKVRSGALDDALALYDEARAQAIDDETRELITINKADALIAADRTGAEVQALPAILMRRRTPRNSFLAAYALMFKHRVSGEAKRAIFYGQIALDAATEAAETFWRLAALNELGMVYEIDSQFTNAIECFEKALACMDAVASSSEQEFSRVAVIGNLGYNKLLVHETAEGLRLMHSVIDHIESQEIRAEAYIDLCYGYLDLEQYQKALFYGQAGLELASEERQIRNAHYLLGEAAYKAGDLEKADFHFDELSRYYPQFRNLKSLLFAIDIRSMINLKL